ncbi:hypothetical protein VPH35_077712 [Triticum aestivum]
MVRTHRGRRRLPPHPSGVRGGHRRPPLGSAIEIGQRRRCSTLASLPSTRSDGSTEPLHRAASPPTASTRGSGASWLLYHLWVVAPPPCRHALHPRGPPSDDHGRASSTPTASAVRARHYAGTKGCSDLSRWKPDAGTEDI